jgi:hypothetical protein
VTGVAGPHGRIVAERAEPACQRHVGGCGAWPGELTGSHRIEESFAHHASRWALGPLPAESQLCAATAAAKDVSRQTPRLSTPLITTRSVSVSFHQRDGDGPTVDDDDAVSWMVYVPRSAPRSAAAPGALRSSSGSGSSGSIQPRAAIVERRAVW